MFDYGWNTIGMLLLCSWNPYPCSTIRLIGQHVRCQPTQNKDSKPLLPYVHWTLLIGDTGHGLPLIHMFSLFVWKENTLQGIQMLYIMLPDSWTFCVLLCIYIYIFIPPLWHGTKCCNHSYSKTRTHLFYIFNIIGADGIQEPWHLLCWNRLIRSPQ